MKRKKPMKVSFSQKEIQRAVLAYAAAQGINLQGKDVTVEFTATRSRETGIIADLTIIDNGDEADLIPAATLVNDEPQVTEVTDKAVQSANLFAASPAAAVDTKPEVVEADTLAATVEADQPAEVQVEQVEEAKAESTAASLFG